MRREISGYSPYTPENRHCGRNQIPRDMIIQRTQEGKSIAKSDQNFKEGRPRKFTPAQIEHARTLLQTHTYSQVESMTGISKSTLKRIKKY